MNFTRPLHQGNAISLVGQFADRFPLVTSGAHICVHACFCVCVYRGVCVCLACAHTMMDDEDEEIDTKSLSFQPCPNLPLCVCTVSQQAKTEE